MRTICLFILLYCCCTNFTFASDTLAIPKKRKYILGISSVALTTSSLIYLNEAWYKQYKTSSFHYFNDNDEWFKLDKCGHMLTTYQTGRLMMNAMNWAGYSKNKQLLIGGLSGFAYMTAIEVMDGYSQGWGFSWGDMAANGIGSSLAIGQNMLWKTQRIQLKYSYSKTNYPQYNQSLLGKNLSEQILKDYNAQTYWISINPSSFIKKENKFPKWLNFAFGYGANGMLNARDAYFVVYDNNGNSQLIKRYQQYYFSLDVDLTRIKTKSKVLKSVFSCLNIIKIPFPNLELSEQKLKFNYY